MWERFDGGWLATYKGYRAVIKSIDCGYSVYFYSRDRGAISWVDNDLIMAYCGLSSGPVVKTRGLATAAVKKFFFLVDIKRV